MPVSSSSTLAPCGETIDLTGRELTPTTLRAFGQPSLLVDLTDSADEEPTLQEDHMHTVVDLIRPRAIDLMDDEPNLCGRRGKVNVFSLASHHQRSYAPQEQVGGVEIKREEDEATRNSVVPLHQRTGIQSPRSSFSISLSPPLQPNSELTPHHHVRQSTRKPLEPFSFMEFPPEIRNLVYRFLLTTPKTPIELPRLTGKNGAAHRAAWVKCKSAKDRRRHKTIFLEVLETCKQVHDEASGILYGCNIFKYRSNPGEGLKPVTLPTRHLQLLKHIKISSVSREPYRGQDETVAAFVRQFARERLKLETFEFTWFGWMRYRLEKEGSISQALQSLDVERLFVIKITGEARMEKAMQEELERVLPSKARVEIHLPLKKNREELSDN